MVVNGYSGCSFGSQCISAKTWVFVKEILVFVG